MPSPIEPTPRSFTTIERSVLESEAIEAIRTVYDPEIPVNVYDLGLIYSVDVSEGGDVAIAMTLTSPACPVAGILPGEVEMAVRSVPGVGAVTVDLVWDPPFTIDRIPDEVKLELGLL